MTGEDNLIAETGKVELSQMKSDDRGDNVRYFKPPKDIQQTIKLAKILSFRIFLFLKNKWVGLVNRCVSANGKQHFISMFCIGLFDFVATTPFSIILILPLTFGTLFFVLDKRKDTALKSQLLTLFAFLFGHFTSIFWWFVVPLTADFLHLFWLTPFALLGLPCLIAGLFMPFFAVGMCLWRKCFLKGKLSFLSNIVLVFIFLLCWYLGDYVRGHLIFGGFPWMLFGHFVPYSFAIQSVRIFGIDIFSILFLALVSVPFFLFFKNDKYTKFFSFVIIGFWILNCIIGMLLLFSAKPKKLNLNIFAVQANMPANLYVDEEMAIRTIEKNANMLSALSSVKKPTLMLMPEGSINITLDGEDFISKKLGRIVPNDNSLLLAGGIDTHGVAPYNVIYAINRDGHIVDMYKKQRLVPFGEYIPFRRFLPRLTRSITGDTFDFATDGDNDLFVFHKNLPIIYPIVCYESIFPDYVKNNIEVSRKRIEEDITAEYAKQINVKTLKERGEVIVNLTNDVWMGRSVGAYQHFLMARFLAVLTDMPVIRVSNNGISAFIDNYGRVKARTSLNKEDLLLVGKK